ncbi:hypothetical protein O0S10_01585 [Methanocorpusculum sp. MG]|uniref:Uncharacterized protein n=1 Tax=Methanocorpusculum petauri TaxID=3002863 RepID=A0ABT4IDV4_9EURY|nr:hypothetical protein [Methanocorpusculum petauri]MCZ0859918.1 hypothetical protein [Methanocorpusculum petauri]
MITITLSDEEAEHLRVVLEDCIFTIREFSHEMNTVPLPLSTFHKQLERELKKEQRRQK